MGQTIRVSHSFWLSPQNYFLCVSPCSSTISIYMKNHHRSFLVDTIFIHQKILHLLIPSLTKYIYVLPSCSVLTSPLWPHDACTVLIEFRTRQAEAFWPGVDVCYGKDDPPPKKKIIFGKF